MLHSKKMEHTFPFHGKSLKSIGGEHCYQLPAGAARDKPTILVDKNLAMAEARDHSFLSLPASVVTFHKLPEQQLLQPKNGRPVRGKVNVENVVAELIDLGEAVTFNMSHARPPTTDNQNQIIDSTIDTM